MHGSAEPGRLHTASMVVMLHTYGFQPLVMSQQSVKYLLALALSVALVVLPAHGFER